MEETNGETLKDKKISLSPLRPFFLPLLALAYILLRFQNLTDSCLWFDEIFGINAAEHSWAEMFNFIAQDLIHPPLFYILLKIWMLIGGDGLFWLRSFPVLFSILALVPFYFLCRQLKLNYLTISAALAFLACNGALIKYSQEVRMYSLLLFFALFSMWFFTRFLHLGKNIRLLTIVNVLLVYTHYFGWFVVLAEVISILVLQRIKIRQTLIMFGVTLLSFAPWIFALFRASQINSDVSQNIGWIPKPNFQQIIIFFFDLIEPFYFQTSNAESHSNFYIVIPILLIIAGAKIYYLVNFKTVNEPARHDLWMLYFFIAVPIFLAFLLSWILPVSIWGTRHLIIVFVPTAILIASFIESLKPEIIKYAILTVLAALFITAFIIELKRPKQEFIWCAWENLATNIETGKIYVFEDLVAYHFWFAKRKNPNVQIIKINNLEGVIEDKAYFLPRGFDDVKIVGAEEIAGESFYIAFRDKEFNLNTQPLKFFVEKGYKIGTPKMIEAQKEKAFLVEIKK